MTTALMAYGLVGLRDDASAIFTFMAIISLQALVSNQFLVTCVWLTPTAVRPAARRRLTAATPGALACALPPQQSAGRQG